MLIEGKNAVKEALISDQTINKLMVQNNLRDNASNEIIKLAKNKGIRIDFVAREILDKKTKIIPFNSRNAIDISRGFVYNRKR